MKLARIFIGFTFFIGAAGTKGYAQGAGTTGGEDLTLTIDLSSLKYPVQKVFFTFYNTTTKVRYSDSAVISTGRTIVFKTKIDEPILAHLHVTPVPVAQGGRDDRSYSKRDNFSLYIEPGEIVAVAGDSLSSTSVAGSATHRDYLKLEEKETAYEDVLERLYNDYATYRKAKDTAGLRVAEAKIDSVDNLVKENVYKPFVEQYPGSAVALYALGEYTGYSIDPDKAQPLYDRLSPSVKLLPSGVSFEQRIELARLLQPGQSAPIFTQKDTLDNVVSLASFKGRFVLIDFWASWCGPCRAENPNVVKAFNDFKDKGFTIIGVSLDRPGQKEKWLKAIHDDGLLWTQVSDLKFWDNEVAKLYDIKAIPQNFLLDRDGKIVARNVRGEKLESTLDQLIR